MRLAVVLGLAALLMGGVAEARGRRGGFHAPRTHHAHHAGGGFHAPHGRHRR
jgi:hypothetical protein